MSFNWSEYLGLAQQLAGKAPLGATEASRLRSAISRAYYAAFIQARNCLRDRDGLTIPTKNTHQYVISEFLNSSDQKRKRIGQDLKTFRYYRNRADYDDIFDVLSSTTNKMLHLAASIITDLETL